MKLLGLILLICIITYFAIGKSLNFSLWGDDWLFLSWYVKGFPNLSSYFDIRNYSTPYAPYIMASIIMGFISKIFSYNPFPYYFISMIIRIIASFSFYLAIYSATKNRFAGYLAALFFASIYSGIETTNWVVNMNTYLSLATFNFFIWIYFLKDHKIFSKETFLLGLFLLASYFLTPTRMHGILLTIPFISILKIKGLNRSVIKEVLIRSFIFYSPILLLRSIIRTTSDTYSLNVILQNLGSAVLSFKILLSSITNSFIPDKLFPSFISNNNKMLITISLYCFLSIFFYKVRKKYLSYSKFGLFSLLSIITFSLIPWLISPSIILSSDHRYQLIPGSFMLVAVAIFCSILWSQNNKLLKKIAIILPIIIILINFFMLRSYLDNLEQAGRLKTTADKYLSYFMSKIEKRDNTLPLVFLFTTDDQTYLYNAITFGFRYRLMFVDSSVNFDEQKTPFPVENLDSLVNVLSSPNSSELKRYGYKPMKVPLENVYGFKLENKELTDITPNLRELLRKRLSL